MLALYAALPELIHPQIIFTFFTRATHCWLVSSLWFFCLPDPILQCSYIVISFPCHPRLDVALGSPALEAGNPAQSRGFETIPLMTFEVLFNPGHFMILWYVCIWVSCSVLQVLLFNFIVSVSTHFTNLLWLFWILSLLSKMLAVPLSFIIHKFYKRLFLSIFHIVHENTL